MQRLNALELTINPGTEAFTPGSVGHVRKSPTATHVYYFDLRGSVATPEIAVFLYQADEDSAIVLSMVRTDGSPADGSYRGIGTPWGCNTPLGVPVGSLVGDSGFTARIVHVDLSMVDPDSGLPADFLKVAVTCTAVDPEDSVVEFAMLV